VVEEQVPTISRAEPPIEPPDIYRTNPDNYGITREYLHGKPSITPDGQYSLADIFVSPYAADSVGLPPKNPIYPSPIQKFCEPATSIFETVFTPFHNTSIYHLMMWFYNSSTSKSMTELNSLINEVILAPDFKREDFFGFRAQKEHATMDAYKESPQGDPSLSTFDDTWIKGTVEISLPCDGVKHHSEADAPKFAVQVYYRKLLDIIKAALSEPAAEKFHMFPFKEFWQPSPNEPEDRIYSEIYTGDAWNQEYANIYAANQQGPTHHLEACLIALMIWSDSTSLAQFGHAQLWPIYLYIGNMSKYSQAKPSSFAAHHIAYIPKVWFLLSKKCIADIDGDYSSMTRFKRHTLNILKSLQPPPCSPICDVNLYTLSGCCSSMMNLCTPISMGFFFNL
jgi:hypothetical protein